MQAPPRYDVLFFQENRAVTSFFEKCYTDQKGLVNIWSVLTQNLKWFYFHRTIWTLHRHSAKRYSCDTQDPSPGPGQDLCLWTFCTVLADRFETSEIRSLTGSNSLMKAFTFSKSRKKQMADRFGCFAFNCGGLLYENENGYVQVWITTKSWKKSSVDWFF